MITYAECVLFRPMHNRLLREVQEHVARISNTWGNELRCHELARAVWLVTYGRRRKHRLVVVDGKCGPIEHSWLCFPDSIILDPYVPGRAPAVQLIDPFVGAYRPGDRRHDIRHSMVNQLVIEMGGGVTSLARRKKLMEISPGSLSASHSFSTS